MRAAKQSRREAVRGQTALVEAVIALLFRHDPIGINFESNTDEYEAEAKTIVIGLTEANSVDDLHRLVYEVFVQWFDAATAGPYERYGDIATDIWDLRTKLHF